MRRSALPRKSHAALRETDFYHQPLRRCCFLGYEEALGSRVEFDVGRLYSHLPAT